jgi:putative phosphoribosyl transferase
MRFRDRAEAGAQLARRLAQETWDDPVVLALPRGGVPVAAPVAAALGTEVVPFVARKLTPAGRPEFGIGGIAEGSAEVLVSAAAAQAGLDDAAVRRLAEAERAELDRRVRLYREGRPLPPVRGRDVLLLDDGLATGVTAEAAVRSLRGMAPRRLVLAAPVGAPHTVARLSVLVDEAVCLRTPERFHAVGRWYERFPQITDVEVLAAIRRSRAGA